MEQDGPLAFADVLGLGADVAGELAERAAAGDPHGGVQPRSVVRSSDGQWVLVAAGLATDEPARAPEYRPGDAPGGPGDVYALGATMVFALTGQQFDDGAGLGDEGGVGGEATEADAIPAEVVPDYGSLTSLPDVMAAFLDTLRRSLASNPAQRITAAALASTLRQLRSDAERVLAAEAAALPSTAMPVLIGAGAAAGAGIAMADGAGAATLEGADALTVDGTAGANAAAAGADTPTPFAQRLPVLIAVAAILVALVLGIALITKSDKSSDVAATGPTSTASTLPPTSVITLPSLSVGTDLTSSTTTSTSTTTTTRPTTTAPVALPPPPTAPPVTTPPPGTAGVVVDMSHMTTCPGCLASLRSQPSLLSQLTAQFPDKTPLWGQCWATGDTTHDDQGHTSNQWIYIVGPVSQGWLPVHLAGFSTYNLPACPQATTTTTAAPTTTTTTTKPTTTTTSAKP